MRKFVRSVPTLAEMQGMTGASGSGMQTADLGSGQHTGYLSGEDAGFMNADILGAIISNNSVISNILLLFCCFCAGVRCLLRGCLYIDVCNGSVLRCNVCRLHAEKRNFNTIIHSVTVF